MSTIESTSTEYTDSYSQLFFFYNTQTKEVLFSSLPMEDFFGSSIDLNNIFPFKNNEQNLEHEWEYCLQLKEKETRNFKFVATSTEGTPALYNFDAVGLNMPVHYNSPVILFSVKKNTTTTNLSRHMKTELIHPKDYAEFIDMAAHDLDAPLRKLSLLIERLAHKLETEPGSDMQDYFTRIQTSLADMRSLVDSLVRLSGLRSGPPMNIKCDIKHIVEDLLNDLRQEEGKEILAVLSDLPVLNGDATQYRQLFQNLLQNAVRFSRKNIPLEIKISSVGLTSNEIKAMGLQEDKPWFRVIVADNGIGFRQEYSEKIFRPFVRLHGKSEYPGTGMGLAICKKIIENHGGIIYAEGNEATGATFTLILPQSL